MLVASGLTWASLAAAAPPAAELAQTYGAALDLQSLPPHWLGASVAGAAILGGLIAALGTRWGLRRPG
jgi:hypothetical protein